MRIYLAGIEALKVVLSLIAIGVIVLPGLTLLALSMEVGDGIVFLAGLTYTPISIWFVFVLGDLLHQEGLS